MTIGFRREMMELVSPAVPLVKEPAQRRHLRLGIPFQSTSTRRTVSTIGITETTLFYQDSIALKIRFYICFINWGTSTM